MRNLGFPGAMTYGAVDVKFLDHADFVPLPAKGDALDVPIDIHPNRASPAARDLYDNDVGGPLMDRRLSCALRGWHQEVALQCLRMIVGGVFGRRPRLQIIIRHMGGTPALPSLALRRRLGAHHRGQAGKAGAAALS